MYVYQSLILCCFLSAISQKSQRLERYKELISRLPRLNGRTLAALIGHLYRSVYTRPQWPPQKYHSLLPRAPVEGVLFRTENTFQTLDLKSGKWCQEGLSPPPVVPQSQSKFLPPSPLWLLLSPKKRWHTWMTQRTMMLCMRRDQRLLGFPWLEEWWTWKLLLVEFPLPGLANQSSAQFFCRLLFFDSVASTYQLNAVNAVLWHWSVDIRTRRTT